jgi:hypothetical protein
MVNWGALLKAAVLKKRLALRVERTLGSLIRFGRCTAKPRLALLLVA